MFKEFLERFCKLEGLDLVVDSPNPPATNFFVGVLRDCKNSDSTIGVEPSFGWIRSPKLVTTIVSGNSVEEACRRWWEEVNESKSLVFRHRIVNKTTNYFEGYKIAVLNLKFDHDEELAIWFDLVFGNLNGRSRKRRKTSREKKKLTGKSS